MLADRSVTSPKLALAAVLEEHLTSQAVKTDHVTDHAIGEQQLALTYAKEAPNGVCALDSNAKINPLRLPTVTYDASLIVSGQINDAQISSSSVTQHTASIQHALLSGVGTFSHAQIDSHLIDAVHHRRIDDVHVPSTTTLWSSAQTSSRLDAKADLAHLHPPSEIENLTVAIDTQIDTRRGAPNGVASLDATGKVPVSQLLITPIMYRGSWDADLNVPIISSGIGTIGDYYAVSVSGNTMVDGIGGWLVGNQIIFNGQRWQKINSPSELITSVAGRTGDIVLAAADIQSGRFADDRISQSSVTQFTGAIDHQLLYGAGTYSHAQLDAHVSDATIHRDINDIGTSNTDLWSAHKITTELSQKAASTHTHAASDVVSGSFADALISQTSVTQHNAALDHTLLLNRGTLTHAQLDAHVADTTRHRQINDASTGTADLWSASKITSELGLKADTVHTHTASQVSDFTAATSSVISSQRGAANGLASLDGSGKVPMSQLNLNAMTYLGLWDASTNIPVLVSGVGSPGDLYIVSVAGSTTLDGISTWQNGDWAIFSGLSSHWERVVEVSQVQSVAGKTGSVTLVAGDISSGTFADARISQSSVVQHVGALDHQSLMGAGTHTHAQIDSHINSVTYHRQINDASTSSTDLWSAAQITSQLSGKAATTHSHDASDIVSGSIGAARIPQAAVTQHNAALQHQTLLGAGVNDHSQIDTHIANAAQHRQINDGGIGTTVLWSSDKINTQLATKAAASHTHLLADITDATGALVDHSSVSIVAGSGLSGGGTIEVSRTLALAVDSLTAKASPLTTDYLLLYDMASSSHKKILVGNIPATTVSAGAGLTGGGSVSPGGSTSLALPTTGVIPGHYAYANITIDAYGRITYATSSDGNAPLVLGNENLTYSSITIVTTDGLGGGATVSLGSSVTLGLLTTGVVAQTYSYATVTVDAFGRITAASSGAAPVTSVALNAPSQFSVSGSPLVGGSGTLAFAWVSQLANVVFAGPTSGGSAVPSFRTLVLADLPLITNAALQYSSVTVTPGTGLTGGGTATLGGSAVTISLANTAVTAGTYTHATVTVDAQGRITAASSGSVSSGTVTSVGLSLPSIFSVSGSPVTTSGTLAATLATQLANLVFAGPSSGGAATPTFRSLVAADVPSLDTSKLTSGTLPVARGGTNSATALSNNRIMMSSSGSIVEAGAMVDGQLLIGFTGSAPSRATLTAGSGISITNGAGSITISASGAAIVYSTVTDTVDSTSISVASGTVAMTSMTSTPAAGTYLVTFSGSALTLSNSVEVVYGLYVDGVLQTTTQRRVSSGRATSDLTLFTQGVITVTGSNVITVQWSVAVEGTTTFTMTQSGSTDWFWNKVGPDTPLYLTEGGVYTFVGAGSSHPLAVHLTYATTGTGDRYTTGVTGTPATTGNLVWTVAAGAPSNLFLNCEAHSAMSLAVIVSPATTTAKTRSMVLLKLG
jgi:hypothetical protein